MIKPIHITSRSKEIALEIIPFLFILLFTYAAVSKLLNLEEFRIQLEQSPFLRVFADWIVWGVPAGELFISVLFFSRGLRLVSMYASFVLMLMFTTYIIIVLNFADAIPCSCGGAIASLSWNEHLLFNFGFIALAVVGMVLLHNRGNSQKKIQNKLPHY